ncbi:hypothetical protein BH10ACI3_BH10ACI3_05960 [soil metagenome]
MKAFNIFRIIISLTAIALFAAVGLGQDTKPTESQPQDAPRSAVNQSPDVRANVLRQLGLSPEQVQQIRRATVARKPQMDAAQTRLREANRSLDEAIYADVVDEVVFRDRLKEAQLAQAEVAKIRFMSELAVRRILTPDQLVRFRELRERFEKAREEFQTNRQMDRKGDRNGFRQRQGQPMKPAKLNGEKPNL